MHRYLPKKQRDQLAMLRHEATAAMNGRNPLEVPVSLDLQVAVPIPRSWSKRKQQAAAVGELLPGTRPDLSNMLKLAEDACNGVILRDDSLVVQQTSRKCYSTSPGITLTITPL
jgi:Holliday junction resolvase RusA-like endonuclease